MSKRCFIVWGSRFWRAYAGTDGQITANRWTSNIEQAAEFATLSGARVKLPTIRSAAVTADEARDIRIVTLAGLRALAADG